MKRFIIAGTSSGFTLIELLVVIAIGGVLLTAIYELLNTNTKLYSSKENTMIMTQDLRAATDILIREIRMAGCNPTGAGGIGFQTNSDDRYNTDANSIRFTMDTDGDGATTSSNEDINYYLYTSGGIQKLGRRTSGAGSPEPVAEYVTNLAFTYYNAAGAVLTPPLSAADLGNIHAVDISITAETPKTDAITHVKKTHTMSTRVKIRNAGLE
uniref:Prepilin-type N-terminal cleavage/methylation domain-containing protein n=1 Tax=Candidatus Desulfatibia profunda TaxID=2841695 RepID=A0A8J6TNG1_9BACT|nr:prepilin-type N-terminal cleavage/methylation domain-containing protein [Candidatus Desulfatibia profunda]